MNLMNKKNQWSSFMHYSSNYFAQFYVKFETFCLNFL